MGDGLLDSLYGLVIFQLLDHEGLQKELVDGGLLSLEGLDFHVIEHRLLLEDHDGLVDLLGVKEAGVEDLDLWHKIEYEHL